MPHDNKVLMGLNVCLHVSLFCNSTVEEKEPVLSGILVMTGLPLFFFFFFFFLPFGFLRLHLRHMEVPRLGVESELQPLAYTTATAMPDPSCVLRLHSLWQYQILNPLSEARDRTLPGSHGG